MHIYAVAGVVYLSPISQLSWQTALLCFAERVAFTGYHRLWSHRAFTATLPLRLALAWMGSMGFQGSIKWWVLRHRLHHRFTDDPEHDPYSSTRGLFYSHCGWIFRKPSYSRMRLIERGDLESDPVVRFQHKHYIPIALLSGLALPALVAYLGWGDGIGGLVWGGAVARLLIWHTTFCINSLAHWTGLQPYTEEVTARGNYLLALLTSGEGNHNFHHAFPKDFRNGPHPADWDPSKWAIHLLHLYTPFVPTMARTPESAVRKARAHVHMAHAGRLVSDLSQEEKVKPLEELPVWSRAEIRKRHGEWIKCGNGARRRRVLLIIEGCVVDAGGYLDDHPGGQHLLLSQSVYPLPSTLTFTAPTEDDLSEAYSSGVDSGYSSASSPPSSRHADSPGSSSDSSDDVPPALEKELREASKSFFGGINNHSGAAKETMRCLRVARLGE
ncbi:stearoyl-CoA desaturase (Delta-9 desaturase), partial [Tremellales sp. Uapishka_1]